MIILSKQIFLVYILSEISIEIVIMGIVVFLCITILFINFLMQKQIRFEKQLHKSRIQKLLFQILAEQNSFKDITVTENEFIKREKVLFYKIDVIKVKCHHLYQLSKHSII